jgi:hypothetical protein
MKTGKRYIQVFIESEDDLPKEDGYYFVKRKNTTGAGDGMIGYMSGIDDDFWLKNIDWYLLPVESTLSDEEMEKEANNYGKFKLK